MKILQLKSKFAPDNYQLRNDNYRIFCSVTFDNGKNIQKLGLSIVRQFDYCEPYIIEKEISNYLYNSTFSSKCNIFDYINLPKNDILDLKRESVRLKSIIYHYLNLNYK